MKKITSIKIILLLSFFVNSVLSVAQITIVSGDFLSKTNIGDTIVTYLDTLTTTINVGNTGQNNWDLSALVVNSKFVATSKTFSSSPYTSDFPTAKIASNYSGVFAGTFSNTWVYNSVENDKFITHGTATVANSVAGNVKTLIKFVPDWIQYKLPIAYGASHSYTGQQVIKINTPVPIIGEVVQNITQKVTVRQNYNGYGIFTLPGGKKFNGLKMIQVTTWEKDGVTSTSTEVRLMAKTGEWVSITPLNQKDTTGIIPVDNISWTSGSGSGVVIEKPNTPSGMTAASNITKIDLTWVDNSSNENGFYIERSVAGGAFVQIQTTGANVSSFSDMNVTPGIEYAYRVRSFNSEGTSAYSSVVKTTIAITVSKPLNLTLKVSSNTVSLTWTDNSNNETGFYIERSGSVTKSGNMDLLKSFMADDYKVIDSTSANISTYIDSKVEEGMTYLYRVRAYIDAVKSDYSNSVTVAIPITVIAPQNLTATINGTKIDLAWKDNSVNEDGFYIERNTAGAGFAIIDSTNSNKTSYSDTKITAGVNYIYRIQAFRKTTKSDYSNTVNMRIIPTFIAGFNKISDDTNLGQNYPNPFSQNTSIPFFVPKNEKIEINVFDANGRIVRQLINSVFEKGEYTIEFNSENLNSGIYFYQFRSSGNTETKQMIIEK